MYSFTYNSLTEIKNCNSDTKFSGSSRFKQVGKDLMKIEKTRSYHEIEGSVYKNYLAALKYCDINNVPYSPDTLFEIEPHGPDLASKILQYRRYNDIIRSASNNQNRIYRLNKTKVRKKITALCRLDDAKKFIAFYSISFPVNAPDDVLYKIFNKWLTNCRTRYCLKTYLWVAERQKNGTLHFHLLTTNRMKILDVNKAMSIAINNEVKAGKMSWGATSAEQYNGVDVDSPQKPKRRQSETREQFRNRMNNRRNVDSQNIVRWISCYLTKYLTKNDIEFKRLPWHCSRNVSALFTSIVINDHDIEYVLKHLPDEAGKYIILNNDKVIINVFLFDAPTALCNLLDKVNNHIFDYCNNSDYLR